MPWREFNGSLSQLILPKAGQQFERATAIAAAIHPAWHRVKDWGRLCHARNVLQILGGDFETPVDKVIAWTPGAQWIGGSRTALVLAQQHGIEIANLGEP